MGDYTVMLSCLVMQVSGKSYEGKGSCVYLNVCALNGKNNYAYRIMAYKGV
jgi:hypothetical protein